MQCRSVLTRIDALRTRELDAGEATEVERHLSTCSSCNESTTDLESFADVVRSLVVEPPRSCCSAVREAVCDAFDSFELDGQRVWVAFSPNGVKRVDVRPQSEDEFRASYCAEFGRDLREKPLPRKYREAVEAALRGRGASAAIADLSSLTPFEREVLQVVAGIPTGEVRTYEWVARKVRRPKAVRAVANVMATNPVPFVLPCHRVVPTSGGIGNYGYGPEMKRRLLEAEGAPVDEIEALAKRGIRYIGSRTSKIFCFPTCRDARRIAEKNRITFHDSKEASESGYRPCKRCTPVAAA